MAAALLDPFREAIGQRLLMELVLLGAVCGPLGVWVVLYRQSYAAESIAHSMLPGSVIAALVGLPLGVGGAAGLALAAAAISLASRQRLIGDDAAVAVTVTALFGAGSLLALSPEAPLRIGELLFGNPLAVSNEDLLASAGVAAVVAAALAGAHRHLALAAFDPQAARSLGGAGSRTALLLLGLIAATTLIAVQALGNLLAVALVIGPAVAALRLCSRLLPALATAAALAIACGIAGIYLSYLAELAVGASIALCAIAPAALSLGPGLGRLLPWGGADPSAQMRT